ncbi:MAG: bifunctional nuclease family protein [Lentisphaerae bacterium]|nr:bifunctional nuclease family protein [Lentisphaerota bacterium]
MIPVSQTQVAVTDMGYVVLLRSQADKRTLPIFIGAPEAQSIAFVLEKVEAPRPLTHDLFKNMLDNVECRMKRIEISELRENTFYARIVLEKDGMETAIDARPSDAIALSLRCHAPILIAEQVMDAAGVEISAGAISGEGVAEPVKKLSVQEDIQKRLEQAIREERYEDAARLRDELKKITHSN